MTDPTHFYITVDQYTTDTTQSGHVVGLSSDEVKSLILDSMVLIDAFIGKGGVPFDESQEFIFPRSEDVDSSGNAFVPRKLTLATRLLCDHLIVTRTKGVSPSEIASESDLGYSYSKFDRALKGNYTSLPDTVYELIEDYILGSGGGVLGIQ